MKSYKNLSILLLIPVLLAGCSEIGSVVKDRQAEEWKPWVPKVETVTRQQDFVFKNGQTTLTKAQMNELSRLAVSTDGSAKVSVRIITHTILDQLAHNPLKSRVNCITRTLIKAGVSRGSIDVVSQASSTVGAGTVITVAVDETKALPIKCNNWNYDMGNTVWPEGEPDFGCATASNLSQMAANPRDLVEGRENDTSDAARSDVFTQFYRIDKIRALMKDEGLGKKK